eukprot:9066291-Ditylum_brightwellii.AAC.2
MPQTETSQSSLKESGLLATAKPQLSMTHQIQQQYINNLPEIKFQEGAQEVEQSQHMFSDP